MSENPPNQGPRDILIRCTNHFKWLLSMQRISSSPPSSPPMTELLTLQVQPDHPMKEAHSSRSYLTFLFFWSWFMCCDQRWGLKRRRWNESFALWTCCYFTRTNQSPRYLQRGRFNLPSLMIKSYLNSSAWDWESLPTQSEYFNVSRLRAMASDLKPTLVPSFWHSAKNCHSARWRSLLEAAQKLIIC